MKKEVKIRKKKEGILKWIFDEIRDSVMFEVAWRILFFIPRMIILFIRNLF
ncbi:hypothetical protein [Paenisporosarcina sp. OV554]|uniref:hypothetical protein n=1 Tax=Paenisporosarcina sp. OV554 TaxID=2135694 RepID=UPI000D4B441C|nr:hypothetical protein [Paenisporosarcina sp. OV554]PUB10130.1 hypothetical protein C8K15_12158 [Paenisporosarcina sp. OV554]